MQAVKALVNNDIPICFIHIGKTGGNTVNKILCNKEINLQSKSDFFRPEKIESQTCDEGILAQNKKVSNNSNQKMSIVRAPIKIPEKKYRYFYNIHEIRLQKYEKSSFKAMFRKYNSMRSFLSQVDRCNLDDMKFIFFVRNPISRFSSAFMFSMIDDYFPKQNCINIRTKYGIFKTPNDLAEAIYTEDDELRTLAQNAMNNIYHMDSIKRYLISCENIKKNKDKILFVGRFEHFSEDIENLCKLCNVTLPANIPHFHDLAQHHSDYRDVTKLTKKAKDNLKKWYSDDFKLIHTLIEINKLSNNYMAELHSF